MVPTTRAPASKRNIIGSSPYLQHLVGEIMNSSEVREKVAADGAEVAPSRSPAEFAKRFAQEMDMWDKFIKSSGIKVE